MGPHKFLCGSKKHDVSVEDANVPVQFMELFSFASTNDIILMTISVMVCVLHGLCLPIMLIVFGDLTRSMTDATNIGWNSTDFTNNSQCQSSSKLQIAPFIT